MLSVPRDPSQCLGADNVETQAGLSSWLSLAPACGMLDWPVVTSVPVTPASGWVGEGVEKAFGGKRAETRAGAGLQLWGTAFLPHLLSLADWYPPPALADRPCCGLHSSGMMRWTR